MSYLHENHGLVNKYDCFYYTFIQNLRLKEIVTDVVEVFASSIFLVLMLPNSSKSSVEYFALCTVIEFLGTEKPHFLQIVDLWIFR